jgi:RNA polymerase sigma-70 factor (ECF subfamily)
MTSIRPEAPESSSFFREYYGFMPRVFQAQSVLPGVVEAEAAMASSILGGGSLSQAEKERIVLATASACRNVYLATLSYQTLSVLGLAEDELDQIMRGNRSAYREITDEALLVTAWANFLCTLATGLALEPDFQPVPLTDSRARLPDGRLGAEVMRARSFALEAALFGARSVEPEGIGPADFVKRVVRAALTTFQDGTKIVNPEQADSRLSQKSVPTDPDGELVARIQGGDVDAFEEIVERHSRRVYRTLIGVLGNADEARDGMQDTFLKAFQHISDFEGRSKFSTWLVSIASNTGIQRLRERCPEQSLEQEDSDEPFRPKELRAWSDDPEQLYAKSELKALVEEGVMKLPAKYRVVLMLKDIEQISIEEVGGALGLGTAAVKSRVLRGRMMLREALAPHFAKSAKGGAA